METLFTAAFLPSTGSSQHLLQHEELYQCIDIDIGTCTMMKDQRGKMQQAGLNILNHSKEEITICNPVPLMEYFQHELSHILLNKRMHPVINRSTKCCYKLGHCMDNDHHQSNITHFCQTTNIELNMKKEKKNYVTMPKTQDICDCVNFTNPYSLCKQHKLFIKDFQAKGDSFSWAVSFVDESPITFDMEEDDEISILIDDIDEVDSVYFNGCTLDYWDITDDEESIVYESENEDDIENICFDESACKLDNDSMFTIKGNTYKTESNFRRMKTSVYHKNCCSQKTKETVSAKKKVNFVEDSKLVKVHYLFAWPYAYWKSRRGPWVENATNRAHFQRRIETLSKILEPVLQKKLKITTEGST